MRDIIIRAAFLALSVPAVIAAVLFGVFTYVMRSENITAGYPISFIVTAVIVAGAVSTAAAIAYALEDVADMRAVAGVR